MRVTILGAGAGGHAMAAELTLAGHMVTLLSRTADKRAAIIDAGGIHVHGDVLGERFVPFTRVTGDIEAAVRGARLVVLPVPGMLQEEYLRLCLPLLPGGTAVWLAPGTGGSLIAHRLLDRMGRAGELLLVETLTLPYAARMSGPARVGVVGRFRARCAAFPARRNEEAIALIGSLFNVVRGENVLDTCLGNPNPLIHPLPGLLNLGWIESRERQFSIYAEGMTPSVVKFVKALDQERLNVMTAAGLSPLDIDSLYAELGPGPIWRSSMGVGKAEKFEERFFTEDVPVGLVTMSSIGQQLGVATPLTDATITLAGILFGTDFRVSGRTAASLGIDGMSAGQLTDFLREGDRPRAIS